MSVCRFWGVCGLAGGNQRLETCFPALTDPPSGLEPFSNLGERHRVRMEEMALSVASAQMPTANLWRRVPKIWGLARCWADSSAGHDVGVLSIP